MTLAWSLCWTSLVLFGFAATVIVTSRQRWWHAQSTGRGLRGSSAGAHGVAVPQVDVVLAHYTEDLTWIRNFEAPDVRFVIYSKSDQPPRAATVLPNVGREGHTFLHHIVRNYDQLAPWTVFSQASEPSWGFEGGNSKSGHLSDNVEFGDYLKPPPSSRDSFFVFSAATHYPAILQSRRVGMVFKDLQTQSKDPCPAGGDQGWSSWQRPWWLTAGHPNGTTANTGLLEFYHRYIALDENDEKPLTLVFPQGARFSVSRERIHKRPRAYYEHLLEQLSHSSNPIEGFWLEAAWFDVFHPEALQSKTPLCRLPALPVGPALSPSEAYETTRRRLLESGNLSEGPIGRRG